MTESADIVIVGGAVMGSSLACHLLSDPAFQGRVLVVEKDFSYARSASALSAASIRQQYSTAVNIAVSLYGIGFLRRIGEELAVGDDKPEIGLKEGGYLYLVPESGAGLLKEINALQVKGGADILFMEPAALHEKFPWLSLDGVAAGSWGRSGEGWFDGWGLMQAFRRKARSLGADYIEGEVVAVERDGNRVTHVRLADGTRIACGALVNCAGAAGGRVLAERAGVKIPVYAKKRCVFSFTTREPVAPCPLLIDVSGVWMRPEGEGFIGGISPDDHDETDVGGDFEVDWSLFEEVVWPALAERSPAFEAIKPGRAWAGHYDMNLFDHNAIVGPAGEPENFYLCNGFSGHGLQQSPAVGRGLAELIVHGRFVTLDLSDFSFARIAEGRPLLERNVI